ncbi:MAG TPA: hypothetical protein PK473_11325, partial [Nitrosomonas sp.]|nr:hypothetical protein [Nitrosomonas sp.]
KWGTPTLDLLLCVNAQIKWLTQIILLTIACLVCVIFQDAFMAWVGFLSNFIGNFHDSYQ